jgi:hypothetical protein
MEEYRLRVFREQGAEEVVEAWRRLCNDKLCNLYALPNVVKVIKSRRMRWAGQLAWGDQKSIQNFGLET